MTCARLWIALVAHNRVVEAELFEESKDAMRARLIEVMETDHDDEPPGSLWKNVAVRVNYLTPSNSTSKTSMPAGTPGRPW